MLMEGVLRLPKVLFECLTGLKVTAIKDDINVLSSMGGKRCTYSKGRCMNIGIGASG